jgi:pimeloyl-ACP methyl ester carboxylesterase
MMSMLEDESMRLPDGRTLAYAIYGSPVPRTTVIYMHGFPSSRFEGKLWHTACTQHNIRLVAPDRPGNGLSTFKTNRRILDWPADVLALADHLKINQFYILGVSGGAPYALACLKEIGQERLLGATIVSGLYPIKFGTAGMMFPSRVMLWVAPWMTGFTTMLFDNMMGKASRNPDPKLFEDMMSKEIDNRHPGDQKAIKDPANWPTFVAMTRESFHQGSEGASWEARLNGSDWGFELGQLYVGENGVPLTLWHGSEDVNCPAAMATKAKDSMPGSVLHLQEGEGHVSFIFRDASIILEDLIGQEESEEYIRVP